MRYQCLGRYFLKNFKKLELWDVEDDLSEQNPLSAKRDYDPPLANLIKPLVDFVL